MRGGGRGGTILRWSRSVRGQRGVYIDLGREACADQALHREQRSAVGRLVKHVADDLRVELLEQSPKLRGQLGSLILEHAE